jgi:hypothetical protein
MTSASSPSASHASLHEPRSHANPASSGLRSGGSRSRVPSSCSCTAAAITSPRTRGDVPTLMFEWEIHMPFVRELVVPYWSLDLFFCGAFFLCGSKRGAESAHEAPHRRHHRQRIVLPAVSAEARLPRPEPDGWTAPLFHALYFNDLPYNLAPSLHISLRSLVWVFYGAHLTGWVRTAVKVWFILIGALHAARVAASPASMSRAVSSWAGPSPPLFPTRASSHTQSLAQTRYALRARRVAICGC